MKKNRKILWLLISFVFAIGAIVLGKWYEQSFSQNARQEKNQHEAAQGNLEGPSVDVRTLFDKDDIIYLAEDISESKISKVESALKEANDKDSMSQLNDAKTRYENQKQFNSLFEKPVLKGKTFSKDGQLKQATTDNDVQRVLNEIAKADSKDAFYTGMTSYINSVRSSSPKQSSDSSASGVSANQALQAIVVDEQVQDGFTMEQYVVARDAVRALPEGEEKNQLIGELEKVQTALTNMGIQYEN